MEILILSFKKTLLTLVVAVAFWKSDAVDLDEINLPGEALSPQDFRNGRTFLQAEQAERKVSQECQIFQREFQGFHKSKDQPSFSKWENGYIPYLVDFQFGLSERATIARAIARLRRVSCINFITRLFHEDFVFIAKRRTACGSFVGRMGGEQVLNLNDECMTEGSVLHELLHVVGFEHEQCRMDRDSYIRVSFYNVSEAGKHNFFKIPPPRVNYAGPYDISSITHYSAFAFAKQDGLQTIFPNKNVNGEHMGQREKLSEMDKLKIRRSYNCSDTIPHEAYNTPAIRSFKSDIHSNCAEFARLGVCDAPNVSSWMQINCRFSCRRIRSDCMDFNESCGLWAKEGECKDADNLDYMSIYCPKSCNLCDN